jgi:pimeloyl-ACP methyl ester carboxylesterase
VRNKLWRLGSVVGLVAVLGSLLGSGPVNAADPTVLTGTIDGADYMIEVAPNWNGTLLLFSHGAVRPGAPNPARDAPTQAGASGAAYLLNQGYALAGSSFSRTGWAVADAEREDIALLDYFASAVAKPKRTIAWGVSLGGSITAQLAQDHPDRFDGALPVSGTLAGGGAWFNLLLDSPFVIKTLVAGGSDLPIIDITDPDAAVAQFQQVVADAQGTPQGRARLALAAAVGDLPGWNDPASAPPAPDDYQAQELNQFKWLNAGTSLIYQRWNLEQHAAGNISSNTGIDYREQLERSPSRDEVYAMYQLAGVDLDADLKALANAPRIQADSALMTYPDLSIPLNGQLKIPVLTLHTTGDGTVVVQSETAYADSVRAAGESRLLRQLFVNRAGHVTATAAEFVTALSVLVHRLDTGSWEDQDVVALNSAAALLGPDLNTLIAGVPQPVPMQPAFLAFSPAPYPRPWDARCATGGAVAIITGELGPICK